MISYFTVNTERELNKYVVPLVYCFILTLDYWFSFDDFWRLPRLRRIVEMQGGCCLQALKIPPLPWLLIVSKGLRRYEETNLSCGDQNFNSQTSSSVHKRIVLRQVYFWPVNKALATVELLVHLLKLSRLSSALMKICSPSCNEK